MTALERWNQHIAAERHRVESARKARHAAEASDEYDMSDLDLDYEAEIATRELFRDFQEQGSIPRFTLLG